MNIGRDNRSQGLFPGSLCSAQLAFCCATDRAMATKPSIAAEKALQKIHDQVTCGICLEPYKQPRLLKCFHVYCEQCLQRLVCGGRRIPCPQCRQNTPLPVGGVSGLQVAFHVNTLLEIQETLKNAGFSDHCPIHPEKEADLYCEQCDQLMCSYCLLPAHRTHQYDLVSELFSKLDKVIVDYLKPLGEQIAMLERAIESVNTRCTAVVEQKTAVVAEIRTAMAHLRQALEVRETELVGQAEQAAQQKLGVLAVQREEIELQLGQLRSCQDFVEESKHTCSQGEILRMKSPLMKRMQDVIGSFKAEILELGEQANMKFIHSGLPDLVQTCQQFGKLHCYQTNLAKFETTSEGLKIAAGGQGESVPVKGGPVIDNPVSFLPNIAAPANIITGLKSPWGIEVREEGEVVVAQSHCVSVISGTREKKSLYTLDSSPWSHSGIAIDNGGNILVVESVNHCITKVSSTGRHLRTVGGEGTGPLHFKHPNGIAVHPHSNKVYITDTSNHRIQVLNSDLSYSNSIGRKGNKKGEFNWPNDIAMDVNGNVYVADRENHRIQVFTADGVYLRQFGKTGEGEYELHTPVSIAISSHNLVYVGDSGNHNIWIFTTEGKFITVFGSRGSGPVQFWCPYGLAVDKKGTLYISDARNNHIQVFA